MLFESGQSNIFATRCKMPRIIVRRAANDNLYRRLTGQHDTPRPDLGKLRTLPPRERVQDFFAQKVSLAKLPTTSPDLFGREDELALLDASLDRRHQHPQPGGLGRRGQDRARSTAGCWTWAKTTTAAPALVYGWSFYSQGAAEGRQTSADLFIDAALGWFGDPDPDAGSPWDKGERLADLVCRQRTLLVLDGLEPLQNPPGHVAGEGRLKDPGLESLLKNLARHNPGLCVISTRLPVADLDGFISNGVQRIDLDHLTRRRRSRLPETPGRRRHTGRATASCPRLRRPCPGADPAGRLPEDRVRRRRPLPRTK